MAKNKGGRGRKREAVTTIEAARKRKY